MSSFKLKASEGCVCVFEGVRFLTLLKRVFESAGGLRTPLISYFYFAGIFVLLFLAAVWA